MCRYLFPLLLLTATARAEEVLPGEEAALGNNVFAVELYSKLAAEPGNLVVSPYSISSALAMTYGGARGDTAIEIGKVLEFFGDDTHPAHAALRAQLGAAGSVSVANSLWGQEGAPFLAAYLDIMKKHYRAGINRVDFKGDAEKARQTINMWVEGKTRERIRELLRRGDIGPDTSLVLVNAIHFKAPWLHPFKERWTKPRAFSITGKDKLAVPTMHLVKSFRHGATAGGRMIELPYKDGRYSMVVVLPDGDLATYEKTLDAAALRTSIAVLRGERVDLQLPRFRTTRSFSLGETMAAMGMPKAFTGKADFSGMNGKRNLFISAIVHKAFVSVNEAGTEAAAATAVVMLKGGRPSGKPVEFHCDRPFLYLIRERKTGCILFMGRVIDPR